MRVIATIEDPSVIHRILAHLGLSEMAGEPMAARAPPPAEWTDE
jgi:hypothetical protein